MADVHAKGTVIRVGVGSVAVSGTTDISTFCNTSSFPRSADAIDLTTYGKNSKVYGGGLLDATFSVGGWYDNATSGTPRVLFEGNRGALFTVVRRAEGTGAGKPQQKFAGILKTYTEENGVADYVSWTAEFQCSDDIDGTAQ